MKRIALTICLLLAAAGCMAQDTNYARRLIRELSSERMWGRGPSHKGDSIAASYLRSEMQRLHLKPLGKNFYQEYSYATFSMEGQCWMAVNGKRLRNYDDFRVMPWSAKVDSRNMKVIVLPVEAFLDAERLHRFVARHEGTIADAFVYIDATQLADTARRGELQRALGRLKKRNPFGSKGIMVGVEQLSTPSFSHCDQQHGYAYLEVQAKAMPAKIKSLDVCVNTQYHPLYRTQNVCGMIEGETDTLIIVGAHYDHLGTMGDGYKYQQGNELHHEGQVHFPGAHDNASGVAAVMDIARICTYEKPHYTMVFLLFSGEEAGLKGSTYAAEHPLVDFSKVKLMLNLDLFCGGDEGLMVFNAESSATKPFFDRLLTLNNAIQVAPEVRPRKNSPNSDHYPFSLHCPSLYILSMGMPYGGYHSPEDVCAACGLNNYYNYLLLVTSLLME